MNKLSDPFRFKMPAGSGRKKGSEWSEVTVIKVVGPGQNEEKAQCNHCHVLISSRIERVRAHLEKCKVRQKNVEKEKKKNVESELESKADDMLRPDPKSTSSHSDDTDKATPPLEGASAPKRFKNQPGKKLIMISNILIQELY